MKKPDYRRSGGRASPATCDRDDSRFARSDLAVSPACDRVRAAAARLQGPGFATRRMLADHLQVGVRDVIALVAPLGLRPNRAGRFAWDEIWLRLWGIRGVPPARFDAMRMALLTSADLARMLGVSERSIRRDGNRAAPRYGLPPHLDLAARIRRHHPLRIHAFERGLEPEPWLQAPSPVRGRLGLVARRAPPTVGEVQSPDAANNRQISHLRAK